jgi:ubiquinone/menaquinone biosynthesis C-methylase UbiE
MTTGIISLACLTCGQVIHQISPLLFRCTQCAREYRAVLGMPDLRVFAPPYLSVEEDWRHAEALAEQYDKRDFAGLLRYKYDALYPQYSEAYKQSEIEARLKRRALAEQRKRIVSDMLALVGREIPRGPLLDIGCGTGPFVLVMAGCVERVFGVDISMEELVLARKRVEEAGAHNYQLAAACAEQLPFAPGAFALAHAMDVIEHVKDQAQTVREVMRVVQADGLFSFNSPNRLDLLQPEPHVDLRFVGFWPRALQEPYVKLLTGREYKGKRLLALPELETTLQRSMGDDQDYQIVHWYRLNPKSRGRSRLGRMIRRAPGLVHTINRVWGWFVNQHEVLVWYRDSQATKPDRARILATAYGAEQGQE